jgi:molybdopterin/thiamine biosynthesis adenylyltransferase
MSEEIYFNEPGFEGEAGTPDGERKNEGYSNIIKYCNIKFAMLEQIRKPPKGFETIIRRHFYLKKDEILEDCKKWIEEAKEHEALYTGLVSDHNYTWCNKFKVKGTYEKMLIEIVEELEKELNALPEPSGADLLPKESKKKKKAHKEAQGIDEGAVQLENIDVDSEEELIVTTNEINVDKDDVKDRWSRYIGAMGIEAVAKQATSKVFLSGASAAGIEVSKNVVLAGCKSFTLHDTKKASNYDLCGQFFLHPNDIGKNRAEASIKRLQQLNSYVRCNAETFTLPKTEEEMVKLGLDQYNIICISEVDYETAIAINNFCRKKTIKFIYFDVRGPFSRIFNDFGEEFIVLDKDGEDLKERWIKNISTEEKGLVEVLDTERHGLDDCDKVAFTEVIGMDLKEGKTSGFKSNSINETIHKIEIVSPFSFRIGDTTIYTPYERNGKITQVKVPKPFKFKSLAESLKPNEIPLDDNMSIADFEKMAHINISHA